MAGCKPPPPKEKDFTIKVNKEKQFEDVRRGHTYGALGDDSKNSVSTLINGCTLRNLHWVS
ncbi:hypothetical protein KY290_011040 [Solanum tuberosum]|uniref:Uncharacterized protein n=1 Tax=Solanum tuberosum TaxID=4113 RepID=A0ABQ7VZH5_SOLTU|nr:hypothetical protein KY290_011040 [Solanum tuberosum]